MGDGVDGVAVGDRVLASCGLGGFAEQVAVAAAAASAGPRRARRRPGGDVHPELLHRPVRPAGPGRLQPGETVLVLGAGGGVGLATIDVARALGGRAIGAASTAAKRDAALAMGAEAVIDTTTEATSRTGPGAWPELAEAAVSGSAPPHRGRPGGRPGRWRPGRAGAAGPG